MGFSARTGGGHRVGVPDEHGEDVVGWFNHRRLFEVCGDIPPAELENAHYRQHAALTEAGYSSP
jgi:hypothetical protein